MRYSPKGADEIQGHIVPLMICTALRAAMIYQACGLDKQKRNFCLVDKSSFFVGGDGGDRTLDLCVANASLSQLSYAPIEEKYST